MLSSSFPIFGKGVKQMLKFFVPLQLQLMNLRDREEGQAATEYAVILAIVAIALIALMIAFRGALQSAFGNVTDAVNGL
jgi:Flp pilus assembly pilin Flp